MSENLAALGPRLRDDRLSRCPLLRGRSIWVPSPQELTGPRKQERQGALGKEVGEAYAVRWEEQMPACLGHLSEESGQRPRGRGLSGEPATWSHKVWRQMCVCVCACTHTYVPTCTLGQVEKLLLELGLRKPLGYYTDGQMLTHWEARSGHTPVKNPASFLRGPASTCLFGSFLSSQCIRWTPSSRDLGPAKCFPASGHLHLPFLCQKLLLLTCELLRP